MNLLSMEDGRWNLEGKGRGNRSYKLLLQEKAGIGSRRLLLHFSPLCSLSLCGKYSASGLVIHQHFEEAGVGGGHHCYSSSAIDGRFCCGECLLSFVHETRFVHEYTGSGMHSNLIASLRDSPDFGIYKGKGYLAIYLVIFLLQEIRLLVINKFCSGYQGICVFFLLGLKEDIPSPIKLCIMEIKGDN